MQMHRSVTIVRSMKSGFCVRADSMSLRVWPKRFAWPGPGTIKASNNMAMASLGWGPQSEYPSVRQYRTERKKKKKKSYGFSSDTGRGKLPQPILRLYICPSPLWGFENILFRPYACHPSSGIANCFAGVKVVVKFTLMSNIYSIYTFNPPECELKRYMSSGRTSFRFISCDPKYSASVMRTAKNVLLFRTCSWKMLSCTAWKKRRSIMCLC